MCPGLSPQRRSLDAYSPFELVFIGVVLVTAGGLAYVMLPRGLAPLSQLLLIAGVMIFLQSSHGFRVQSDLLFVILLGIAYTLVLAVDWWPLQLIFARAAGSTLRLLGVSAVISLNPHFGGLQVLLFVPAAGTGSLVGGEIDNACAGLPVLVPALLLLWFAKPASSTYLSRIAVFAVAVVVLGDLARIVAELWLPAAGVAPFDLVHYPGALVLGLTGLVAIALAAERWKVEAAPQI